MTDARHAAMRWGLIRDMERAGYDRRMVEAIVTLRDSIGWTPEERAAVRAFCRGANCFIGVHIDCDHPGATMTHA